MPYVMQKKGDRFCLYAQEKPGGPAGAAVPGGCHPDRKSALKHMRALYANVPDARASTLDLRALAKAAAGYGRPIPAKASATQTCPQCGKEVAAGADTCPMGHPMPSS